MMSGCAACRCSNRSGSGDFPPPPSTSHGSPHAAVMSSVGARNTNYVDAYCDLISGFTRTTHPLIRWARTKQDLRSDIIN